MVGPFGFGHPIHKRIARVVWSIAGFYALGYFPTVWLKDPRPSMIAAAMGVIPFVIGARRIRQGVLRGAGLGLVAGLSLATGILNLARRVGPDVDWPRLQQAAWTYTLATALLCAAVGLVFSLLGRRRRTLIDRQWQRLPRRRR